MPLKIIIADISSFFYEGKIIGHWANSAKMYQELLRDDFNVTVAGSALYKSTIKDDLLVLPKGTEVFRKLSYMDRIKKVYREIKNCRIVLKEKADIIVFQSSGYTSMLFCLSTAGPKKLVGKHIYFIQYSYQCNKKINRLLWNKAKNRISGVITSTEKVGQEYGINYLSIPDYICTEPVTKQPIPSEFKYDFCMVGTMNSSKDIEMVVDVFSRNEGFRVRIAGFFSDKERYRSLREKATNNIEISDGYLSNDEYNSIIQSSKFCLLPYKNTYNDTTSGVIYDYLFRNRPVIYRDIPNFSFMKIYNAGITYKNTIEEVLAYIDKVDYLSLLNGIKKLAEDNCLSKEKLVQFLLKR